MVEVALRGAEKRWGDFVAVRSLDLEIFDREFLVLLGPSGCGKTTTMRMIAGLEAVTAGDILIDGLRVNELEPRDRDIAMVFQNYGLYPHKSVRENIAYPLRLRKLAAADITSRVEEVARKVQLDRLLDRRPRALSGGQRQRVALARAIVRTPRLFLMDEPLSNLDAKLRVSMRAELRHMHHEMGTTTVYVTHDQIEAMTLATRVAVMNKGEIVQLGTPQDIYQDPDCLFVASFIGSPPMNFAKGNLAGGSLSRNGFSIGRVESSFAGDAVLGVRPEHVSVVAEAEAEADVVAPIYAIEFTGQSAMVTVLL
ncbi:MAG: ABC transporter ATP-binding protein, partial [Verrucomicrobia bacterium]|nr:ABC transporter ATP-binding protein [Verrucomicrobiota bacterium]